MQDDKFKKLPDEEMERVSGGRTFSVVNTGTWWKGHHVVDENGNLYGRCWTQSGANEMRDELNGLNLAYTIQEQKIQSRTYDLSHERKVLEHMQN